MAAPQSSCIQLFILCSSFVCLQDPAVAERMKQMQEAMSRPEMQQQMAEMQAYMQNQQVQQRMQVGILSLTKAMHTCTLCMPTENLVADAVDCAGQQPVLQASLRQLCCSFLHTALMLHPS
jgi:hypothetical protein